MNRQVERNFVIPNEAEESLTVSVFKMPTTEIFRDVSTSLDMTKKALGTSRSLFASLDVYHDIDSRSAAVNMAIDEAILETATVPTIRFYQWNHPALSFGYFGKFADVADQDRDLVRRWTGGGIVFHGDDLTYSIVIPATDVAFGGSSMSIYEKVHAAIQLVLARLGRTTELWGAHAPPRAGDRASAVANFAKDFGEGAEIGTRGACAPRNCFANPVRADVIANGQKIAGAAQRRTRRGLLQQGSIQNVHLDNTFADAFAKALCPDCEHKNVDSTLVTRAEEIAAQKYGSEAWLRRR